MKQAITDYAVTSGHNRYTAAASGVKRGEQVELIDRAGQRPPHLGVVSQVLESGLAEVTVNWRARRIPDFTDATMTVTGCWLGGM